MKPCEQVNVVGKTPVKHKTKTMTIVHLPVLRSATNVPSENSTQNISNVLNVGLLQVCLFLGTFSLLFSVFS